MAGVEAVGLALNATDIGYKVVTAAIKYGQKVRSARQQTEIIRHDVKEIIELLDNIRARAAKHKESDGSAHQWMSLQDMDSCFSPLQRIKQALETVLDLLNNSKMSKLEQLMWPRKLRKIEMLMQMIAKEKAILAEKIQIDTGQVDTDACLIYHINFPITRFQTLETDKKVSELISITESKYYYFSEYSS